MQGGCNTTLKQIRTVSVSSDGSSDIVYSFHDSDTQTIQNNQCAFAELATGLATALPLFPPQAPVAPPAERTTRVVDPRNALPM